LDFGTTTVLKWIFFAATALSWGVRSFAGNLVSYFLAKVLNAIVSIYRSSTMRLSKRFDYDSIGGQHYRVVTISFGESIWVGLDSYNDPDLLPFVEKGLRVRPNWLGLKTNLDSVVETGRVNVGPYDGLYKPYAESFSELRPAEYEWVVEQVEKYCYETTKA